MNILKYSRILKCQISSCENYFSVVNEILIVKHLKCSKFVLLSFSVIFFVKFFKVFYKMSENLRMECRKIRKPKIEKLRRARINTSLETLKQMLLQNTIAIPQGGRPAKLEKADILEMTCRYVQVLHKRLGIPNFELAQTNQDFVENSAKPFQTLWSNDGIRTKPKLTTPTSTYSKIISKIDNFPSYKQETQVYENSSFKNYENMIYHKSCENYPNINKENFNPFDSDEDSKIQATENGGVKVNDKHWRPW